VITAKYKVDHDHSTGSNRYRVWERKERWGLFGRRTYWDWMVGTGTDDYEQAIQTARKIAANPVPFYV
jgi:hypothetical protein